MKPTPNPPAGQFAVEISLIQSTVCPICGCRKLVLLLGEHRDTEGEITYWDGMCQNCKAIGKVFND